MFVLRHRWPIEGLAGAVPPAKSVNRPLMSLNAATKLLRTGADTKAPRRGGCVGSIVLPASAHDCAANKPVPASTIAFSFIFVAQYLIARMPSSTGFRIGCALPPLGLIVILIDALEFETPMPVATLVVG